MTDAAKAALRAERISKTFPGQVALHEVSLTVGAGEIHAVLGANGSGKSTLVKILAGVHAPDRGSGGVTVGGAPLHLPATPAVVRQAGLRFVHQDLGLIDRRPVLENLVFGRPFLRSRWGLIDWRRERKLGEELLANFAADFSLDELVVELSRAQQTMVAVMRAFGADPEAPPLQVLALDEPTVGLPPNDVARVWRTVRAMAGTGVGVLAVTHAIDEVEEECDGLTVLRDGRVVLEARGADLAEGDIVEAIAGERLAAVWHRGHVPTDTAAKPVFEVRALRTSKLRGLDLALHGGEIVGVAGGLDSGVSQLLPALYGDMTCRWEQFTLNGRAQRAPSPRALRGAGMVYVPSKRGTEACFTGLGLRENLTAGSLEAFRGRVRVNLNRERSAARQLVEEFGIISPSIETPIELLSGGNQQKAILARWFPTDPAVVLLDEPTQGIDVAAKVQIHNHVRAIASRGAAVLVASSEQEELASLCDRVLVLQRGHVVRALAGDQLVPSAITHALYDNSPLMRSPS